VLGVSFDSQAENAAFAAAQRYPFPLLCDTARALGLAYGTCDSAQDAYARRYTYVIDATGRIERAIATQDPKAQAEALLPSL
jgi:peroxiredoxin Q/BCP